MAAVCATRAAPSRTVTPSQPWQCDSTCTARATTPTTLEALELETSLTETKGTRLHVVAAGPQGGPLVILLHRFPEFWYGWRTQIPALAEAGYRVWVPDQRGYNISAKPSGVRAYAVDELTRDVLGLIEASGREKVTLVGHDWGATVTWWSALTFPQRLDKLVILNAPHPAVMRRALRSSPKQLLKSWYLFFFQLPRLPEALAKGSSWAALGRTLTSSSRPGTFSDADLTRYRAAWEEPGAYSAMLNWYRALLREPPERTPATRVRVPTLILWGARDRFLAQELAPASLELCEAGELEVFEEATHWLQHEEAARVNARLLEFFADSALAPERRP